MSDCPHNRDGYRLAWGLLLLQALIIALICYALAHLQVTTFHLQPKAPAPGGKTSFTQPAANGVITPVIPSQGAGTNPPSVVPALRVLFRPTTSGCHTDSMNQLAGPRLLTGAWFSVVLHGESNTTAHNRPTLPASCNFIFHPMRTTAAGAPHARARLISNAPSAMAVSAESDRAS